MNAISNVQVSLRDIMKQLLGGLATQLLYRDIFGWELQTYSDYQLFLRQRRRQSRSHAQVHQIADQCPGPFDDALCQGSKHAGGEGKLDELIEFAVAIF